MIVIWSTPTKFHLFSWLITKFLGTNYSHNAFLFNIEGIDVIFHATRKGVYCIPYKEFLKKNDVIEFLTIENKEKEVKALRYCLEKAGTKYGFLTVIMIALNLKFSDGTKSMICSELIARALDLNLTYLDLIDPRELKELLLNKEG